MLKKKTSALAQIAITHYYILFTNLLTWYEVGTYNWNTLRKKRLAFHQLGGVVFSQSIFWFVNYTLSSYKIHYIQNSA